MRRAWDLRLLFLTLNGVDNPTYHIVGRKKQRFPEGFLRVLEKRATVILI